MPPVPRGRDVWVTVTGTYRGLVFGVPELAVTSVRIIPTPTDRYE